MKKHIFTAVCALALLGLASPAFSQKDSIITLPPITITAYAHINQKVSAAFQKHFRDAMDDRWYRLNKDYLVRFIQNDVKNNALFTKRGNLVYSVSYGGAQDLPDAFRSSVQQSYPDFNITRAVNVKESARNIWVVNLESLNRYVLVRLENGELEEVGNYQKSL